MPILARETDIYPNDLFEMAQTDAGTDNGWWALYTLSRREKQLMRRLRVLDVPFYCPIIAKRSKSPAGRVRTSHTPLFSNYVFIWGDEQQRYLSLTTGCVSRHLKVVEGPELVHDLEQIHGLIQSGIALSPESRLQPGMHVRIRSGTFRDYEGIIIRREGQTRLLVAVNFLQQGASILLEDCELEELGSIRQAG